jgi:hypothetical protein
MMRSGPCRRSDGTSSTSRSVTCSGNLAANRTNLVATIGSLAIPNGATFWIRWNDLNASGADDGLAVDDFFLTPQGAVINNPVVPTCPSPVTTTAGTGTTQGVSATDSDGTVTSATITGITDDPVLGTHTIAWTAAVAKKYRVQKSTDGGANWEDMAAGFPTGGSPGTNLFFEDRVTPFADPRPNYRVLQE